MQQSQTQSLDVKSVLAQARDLLAKGWVKEHYGEDAEGNTQHALSEKACKFCIVGALARVLGVDASKVHDNHPAVQALNCGGVGQILLWNDEDRRTQADVLALFDKAIAA
ncbi:hypothetical protein JF546_19105 [Nitratireductor aquimarinus]|uniref:DUF6197 family protein n=1 Tax=Nitratireductor aquimarinus TaxID=889300 RepID=UPI001A8FF3FD|nr:hypothetical protein [Nitratireductor aquimarinus]MBN8245131.1 hypothetical protein [Nitratireductor aquimarinus]MBY6133516.1 hypothetical protein [Nitratireductor aquimarinus]MCA1304833.1 hypothetical protein [Nitratireductor aquimarinus]